MRLGIKKSIIQFSLLYDKYSGNFKGPAKFILDLILFLLISSLGIMTLSLVYTAITFILKHYFVNSKQVSIWILVILIVVFILSKIIEEFKKKRGLMIIRMKRGQLFGLPWWLIIVIIVIIFLILVNKGIININI